MLNSKWCRRIRSLSHSFYKNLLLLQALVCLLRTKTSKPRFFAAGWFLYAADTQATPADWQHIIAAHLCAAMICCQQQVLKASAGLAFFSAANQLLFKPVLNNCSWLAAAEKKISCVCLYLLVKYISLSSTSLHCRDNLGTLATPLDCSPFDNRPCRLLSD